MGGDDQNNQRAEHFLSNAFSQNNILTPSWDSPGLALAAIPVNV